MTAGSNLEGRTAFVAGASRGIGRRIAEALATAGASVAVAARSEEPGKLPGTVHSVAEAIRAAGGQAIGVPCDVTSEASVDAAVEHAAESLGGLDILVANAGVMWLAPISDTPLSRWELCLRVNLTGVFLVTKAVLPHVLRRGGGSLIAITTNGVTMTRLGSNVYWVSKAGVERLYSGLATELAPHDVAVNCLAPSKVVMTEGAIASGISVSDDMTEPPDAIAAAAVHLAGCTPEESTGKVHYSLDLLDRLKRGSPLA